MKLEDDLAFAITLRVIAIAVFLALMGVLVVVGVLP